MNRGIVFRGELNQLDSDSIWQEDSDFEIEAINRDNWESNLSRNELNNIKTKFEKLGVREGILTTKDSHGQLGFDQGFEEGLSLGKIFGTLHGAAWALNHLEALNFDTGTKEKLTSLVNDIYSLGIDDVLDREHFKKYPNQINTANETEYPFQSNSAEKEIPLEVCVKETNNSILGFLSTPDSLSSAKADKLHGKCYSKLQDIYQA